MCTYILQSIHTYVIKSMYVKLCDPLDALERIGTNACGCGVPLSILHGITFQHAFLHTELLRFQLVPYKPITSRQMGGFLARSAGSGASSPARVLGTQV